MELRRYAALLRQRWLLILLSVLVAGGYVLATSERTITYTARATLYVGVENFIPSPDDQAALTGDRFTGLNSLVRTFSVMVASTTIAEDVVARTRIPRSPAGLVSATAAGALADTNILAIQVTDVDPAIAQTAATGFAEAFVDRIAELEPGEVAEEGAIPRAPVRIFERAQLPVVPTTSSPLTKVLVAMFLAFAASAGLVLLVDYLDVTFHTAADTESKLELPVLGVIPALELKPLELARSAVHRRRDELELVSDG